MRRDTPLILASASPRRAELLSLLGLDFEVFPSQVPEEAWPGESPCQLVQRLAKAKAEAVLSVKPGSQVIGADTVVVCEGQIFGKPDSVEAARKMLRQLSGRSHQVLTGVCVASEQSCLVAYAETDVTLLPLSDLELETYLQTGEPLDKAGAYAIQGYASRFIEKVNGCYFNVVGLPLSLLYQMLKQAGWWMNG